MIYYFMLLYMIIIYVYIQKWNYKKFKIMKLYHKQHQKQQIYII